MKKNIIIFDMDGVLFDSIPFAEEFYLQNHPGMTSEMYKEIHSGNFHVESNKYSHFKKEESEEEKNIRHLVYAESKSNSRMFEGTLELLRDLYSKGFMFILNTNARERNCLPLLEKNGIKDMFDFVTTAELSTSKVEKFKIICNRYGVNSNDVIFVTDSLGDIREADIAEIPTVAVTWGVHNESFFEREKHDNLIGVVHTVKELKDIIIKKFYA